MEAKPVYIAYFDDSGSDSKSDYAVIAAIVMPDEALSVVEKDVAGIAAMALPDGKRHEFTEFHAKELFHGTGVFECLDLQHRRATLMCLFNVMQRVDPVVVWAAVERNAMAGTRYEGADPLVLAFRTVCLGVEEFISLAEEPDRQCMFIADNCADGSRRQMLKRAFREMRKPVRFQPSDAGELVHTCGELVRVHDEMYFGDSADCVGLQLADLCAFFALRCIRNKKDGRFWYRLGVKEFVFDYLVLPHLKVVGGDPETDEERREDVKITRVRRLMKSKAVGRAVPAATNGAIV